MPRHTLIGIPILVVSLILIFPSLPYAQIDKGDTSQESFDIPPPPPPPRKLTSSEFTQLYNEINNELDSLEIRQHQYPFLYQYTIENHIRQCLDQEEFSTTSNRDTLYLKYTVFSSGQSLLMRILDSDGDIKNQEIIQPIHNCIYEMELFDRSNDKIDPKSNRPEMISFRSILVLQEGKLVSNNDH
jgi:hypothetical protein